MTRKTWLFIAIGLVAASWLMAARKFENIVRTTYLPILQQQKDKGLIDLDLDNVKIRKYIFTVTAENLVIFPKSTIFRAKLDQISFSYNPLNNSVSASSSGKKFSVGSEETEIYALNPHFVCKINDQLLHGNMNDIRISLQNGGGEIFRASDNVVIASDKGSLYEIIGKLDEKTNQYSLKIVTSAKGITLTRDYFKLSNQLIDKMLKLDGEISGLDQINQKSKNFVDDLSADYYYAVVPNNLVDANMNFSIIADRSRLENIYNFIQGKDGIQILASFADFDINKELFNISITTSYGNGLVNNKFLFDLSGNGRQVTGNLGLENSKNYPKDKIPEVTKLTSELLAKVFSHMSSEGGFKTRELPADDFMNLASSFVNMKNIKFNANLSREVQSSDTNASVHFGINEYAMDLTINNKNKEPYKGVFILSDPFKMINAKTKFAHEVALPFIEKINNDKASLAIMQQYITNIENNGFTALKVFSKNPELVEGDKFEAEFDFDPNNFSLKINDKSFLEIVTDERIVNFLRGFGNKLDIQSSSAEEVDQEKPADQGSSVIEPPAAVINNNDASQSDAKL